MFSTSSHIRNSLKLDKPKIKFFILLKYKLIMIKTNLLKMSALALAFLSWTGADAQTTIWGVGSSNAASIPVAEFQNPFVQGTDPTVLTDTAWNSISINEANGTVTPGNAYWERSTTASRGNFSAGRLIGIGAADNGSIAPTDPNSTANGFAIFDSDFKDNAGLPNNFGNGVSPAPHSGVLISPLIDLSGYTDSALVLKTNVHWRNFSSTVTVSMSVDNGFSWVDVDLADILPTDVNTSSEGRISVPFYTATANATNLTQCRIRFTFSGEYYVVMFDDLSIETVEGYDLSIRRPDPNGTNLAAALVDIKVGMNRYIPASQIDTTNLKEWFWGASVINYGPENMTPAANAPVLYMSIDHVDPITSAVTPGVYLDTIVIQSDLNAGGTTQVDTAKNLRSIAFLCDPARPTGDYVVTYWLEHNTPDTDNSNDTARHTFTITDDGTAKANYLSKVRLNANGQPFAAGPTFPGDPIVSDFEYGSMFYFHRGAVDSVTIDSIDFRYYIANAYSGAASQTLFINVYQWNDLDASGTLAAGNAQGNPELTQVGLNTYVASGLGTTHAPGSFEMGRITSLLSPTTGLPLDKGDFSDTSFYLVTVQVNPSLTGGGTMTSDDGIWIGRDALNYAMNAVFTTGADPLPNVSPVKVVDGGGTGDWNWVGFGADQIPSIGLYLGTEPVIKSTINTATVYADAGMNLSVFPNPTTDVLNVNIELDEATDITYIVTDVAGRVINMAKQTNVLDATSTLDVSALAGGVYFITAKGANGKEATQRFVKK